MSPIFLHLRRHLYLSSRPLQDRQGILPLETLREAEAELLSRYPAIQTVPYNGLAESLSQSLYLNSDGALREMSAHPSSSPLCPCREDGRKPRSGGAVRLGLGSQGLDVEGCINQAIERTVSHLAYEPIETGSYRVCFKPEAFLSLIGAFSSMFNARSVLDGVSLSNRDSIGDQIAVPFLSLHDNGLHPGHVSASAFDGEGTPTRRLCLINGGELSSFLHSEATARAFVFNQQAMPVWVPRCLSVPTGLKYRPKTDQAVATALTIEPNGKPLC